MPHERVTKTYSWDIPVWSWLYDGQIYQEKSKLFLEVSEVMGEEQAVTDFSVYPLLFANSTLKEQLSRRGNIFWKCRFCRPMSYCEDASSDRLGTTGERYVIDMKPIRRSTPRTPSCQV